MKLTTKPINISFRSASREDLDQILAIEVRAYSQPWSLKKFADSYDNPSIKIQLILLNGQIKGYLLTQLSIEFIDILNICIDPEFQQQGLGKKLLDDLLEQQEKTVVKSIFLEVRVSNVAAINFYQNYGFKLLDTRKKYYSNLEDAKILRLQIN
ncbi:ribosomal protein S18-alanine N-acetyltransferase [Candidatus Thioglobus sp.]|uniref:ribosomal protein S18-alanine N-acetyltransferase n=1 Tax=Candidatus Thioglobus sp. TaxID=2026721 RepID=UPI003D0B8473